MPTTLATSDAPIRQVAPPRPDAENLRPMTIDGIELLVRGDVDRELLADLVRGPGDLWHSGLGRGCGGLLGELRYWDPVYWFYLNDAGPHRKGVSWRVDATAFAVRRESWERLGGFDRAYRSATARGLDLGFRMLRHQGVPLHVPGLFPPAGGVDPPPREDLYLFFVRHFKKFYRLYALAREFQRGRPPLAEWRALRCAERAAGAIPPPSVGHRLPRALAPLPGEPARVSVIIPTLGRQEAIGDFLGDLARQTLPPHQVLVVDQNRPEAREGQIYAAFADRLPLEVIWQDQAGACRARNEGIRRATGDYLVFADDDIRARDDFLEAHVRLLETYGVESSNGLVINSSHPGQGPDDLTALIRALEARRRDVRVETTFATANACVRKSWVERCVGFDLNFEGGFWEDTDFGMRLVRQGAVLLSNPDAAVLHRKSPRGGFRWWDAHSRQGGRLPWQVSARPGRIKPRPSPTVMYGFLKHGDAERLREWKLQYVMRSWRPKSSGGGPWRAFGILGAIPRALATPWTLLRIRASHQIASRLIRRGPQFNPADVDADRGVMRK